MSQPLTAEEIGYPDWVKAKRIIEKFLTELMPGLTTAALDHNSSALLARFAHAEMLVETIKEET